MHSPGCINGNLVPGSDTALSELGLGAKFRLRLAAENLVLFNVSGICDRTHSHHSMSRFLDTFSCTAFPHLPTYFTHRGLPFFKPLKRAGRMRYTQIPSTIAFEGS